MLPKYWQGIQCMAMFKYSSSIVPIYLDNCIADGTWPAETCPAYICDGDIEEGVAKFADWRKMYISGNIFVIDVFDCFMYKM